MNARIFALTACGISLLGSALIGCSSKSNSAPASATGTAASSAPAASYNNAGFDRQTGKMSRPESGWQSTTPEPLNAGERDRGMANYVFADGHAKAHNWSATWRRIAPDVVQNNVTLTPTMWRQNFGGWNDLCGYRAP